VTLQESIERASRDAKRWWDGPPWWYGFIVTPWVLLAAISLYESRNDRSIATREQTAPGTIVAHEPRNHDRYGYAFTVGGKSYTGWDGPTGSEQPTIGQAVTVYYDPSDPSTSALVDFRELALRNAGPVPFAIGGSGLVVLFILTRRYLAAVRK